MKYNNLIIFNYLSGLQATSFAENFTQLLFSSTKFKLFTFFKLGYFNIILGFGDVVYTKNNPTNNDNANTNKFISII